MTVGSWRLFGFVSVALASMSASAVGQTCSAPHSASDDIDASYSSTGTGWWEMRNWVDVQLESPANEDHMGDGGVGTYPGGHAKAGLAYPIAGGDWFAFALPDGTENPQGSSPGQRNQPIIMADPSVMRIDYPNGETWYYVTGTSGAIDIATRCTGNSTSDSNADELAILGTQQANFIIYRTKDFFHFYPHMTVFDERNRNSSGQSRTGRILTFNQTTYADLKSPHLYFDPWDANDGERRIFLTFSANQAPYAPGGVPTEEELLNDSSVFLVSISQEDFASWHSLNWFSDAGPRFSNANTPAWYGYLHNSVYRYDGGVSLGSGHYVPASGDPDLLAGSLQGQLEWRTTTNSPAPSVMGRGWGHRMWASHTWMAEGPYVFFDPKATVQNGRTRTWMIYDWNDAYGPTDPLWGNAVVMHALEDNHKTSSNTVFLVNNRNSTENPVNGKQNGRLDKFQNEWYWGGIAESAAMTYLSASDRYYFLFSRNTWDSAAYQILYRQTGTFASGAGPGSFALGGPNVFGNAETILLRSDRYNVAASATTGNQAPASFGSPSVFAVKSSAGVETPFIAFHAKFESSARRTVFFKELVVENTTTGTLRQLQENSAGATSASAKQTGINYFRIPECRPN